MTPSAVRLGHALVQLGGQSTPGQLSALTGIGATARAHGLGQLESTGLVVRTNARVALTTAGLAVFATAATAALAGGAGSALDDASRALPYAHAAQLRLASSVIVARHHLASSRPDPWPGLIMVGETRTGKSALAAMLCHLFGFDLEEHTRDLQVLAEGELAGRRTNVEGRIVFQPSVTVALPFVFFDEYDKATKALRDAVQPFLQGKHSMRIEGRPVVFQPVPMVAANAPASGEPLAQFHQAYLRRCFVLSTSYARRLGFDFDKELREYYAATPPGALKLDQLRPPQPQLPSQAMGVLQTMTRALTDRGREAVPDHRALEVTTLGRAALMAVDDDRGLTLAAYLTAVDYLQVSETVPGQVDPGWQLDLGEVRAFIGGSVDTLDRALEAGRQGRRAAQTHARNAVVRTQADDLALLGDRHELAEQIRGVLGDLDGRRVPREHKPQAANLRAQLAKLRTRTLDSRSRSSLEEARILGQPLLASGAALRHRIDREAIAIEQEKRNDADQRQQARATERRERAVEQALRRTARESARANLAVLRTELIELERLYRRNTTRPDESPLGLLSRLPAPSGNGPLVRYVARPAPNGLLKHVAALSRPWPGYWQPVSPPARRFFGSPQRCPELDQWGPSTRILLTPLILERHAQEDLLCHFADRRPRPGRLKLSPLSASRWVMVDGEAQEGQ